MARVRFLMVVGVLLSVLVLLVACVGTVSANGANPQSCDDNGDPVDVFQPQDLGGPAEIYLKATNLAADAKYDVWIVEYKEGVVACPWQVLDKLGGIGDTLIDVETDESGTIKNAPVHIWTVPDETYVGNYYEIVLDKHASDVGDGKFDEDDDALDAIDISEPGFKVMPELPTVLLLGLGLVGAGAYVGMRRYAWRIKHI